jgi:hypothetical protein
MLESPHTLRSSSHRSGYRTAFLYLLFLYPLVPTPLCPFRFAPSASPIRLRPHQERVHRFEARLFRDFRDSCPVDGSAARSLLRQRSALPKGLAFPGEHRLDARSCSGTRAKKGCSPSSLLPQEPAPPATRQTGGGLRRTPPLPFGPEPRLRVLRSTHSGHQEAGRALRAGQRRECPRRATLESAPNGNSQQQEPKQCHPLAQPRKLAAQVYAGKRNKRSIGAWLGL